jgi:hypothetical protein
MWPFRKRPTPQPEADGMNITPRHIEAATDYLMRCSAFDEKDGVVFEKFVKGVAWYDQAPFAVELGLDPGFEGHPNAVYSYLGLMFFLAAEHAHRAGLGHLEERGGRTSFVLTREGRGKYPRPDGEAFFLVGGGQ